jgi:hypothetical protein
MDKFLDTDDLPKLNQEDTCHWSRSTSSKDIEIVTNNLPAKKNPGPDGLTAEFYQIFKEKVTATFLKLF